MLVYCYKINYSKTLKVKDLNYSKNLKKRQQESFFTSQFPWVRNSENAEQARVVSAPVSGTERPVAEVVCWLVPHVPSPYWHPVGVEQGLLVRYPPVAPPHAWALRRQVP